MSANAKNRTRKPREGKVANPSRYRLETFVSVLFLPLVCAARSHSYRSQCRRAVVEFSEALGRPATLADLTLDAFSDFRAKLRDRLSPPIGNMIRKRLMTIWRYAAKFGYVTLPAKPERPKGIKALVPKRTVPTAEPGSLREFFDRQYKPQRLLAATNDYIVDCVSTLILLETYAGKAIRPEDLTDELAAGFFRSLVEKKLSAVRVNRARAILFSIWRFAHERGVVATLPTVKKLKVKRDEPDAWTEAEMGRIVEATKTLIDRPSYDGINATDYIRALLLFAWWTGLRRGSIFAVRIADVDLASGWIVAGCQTMKNGKGKQYRLGSDAIDAIQKVMIPGAAFLFQCRDFHRIYADFGICLKAAGIAPSRRRRMSKFHKIRRTVATALAMRSGIAAASSHLGHSSEQITLRYIDPSKLPGNDATAILPTLSCATPSSETAF